MENIRQAMKWAAIALLAVIVIEIKPSCTRVDTGGDAASTLKGQGAPHFSLPMVDGGQFNLAGEKGNVVLLDFWATWCPPCLLSLPHVQKLAGDEALMKRGLKVFAVNAGETPGDVKPFLAENHYTFQVPMDSDNACQKMYRIDGLPTTVIIGRDGKVANVFAGYGGEETEKDIDSAIDRALGQGSPN